MSDIFFEKYSDKSFVIRGETTPYKDVLIELGGSFNPRLKGGAGWIFSNYCESKVKNWMQTKTKKPNDIVVDNDDDVESEIIELRDLITKYGKDLNLINNRLTELEQKNNIQPRKRLIQ